MRLEHMSTAEEARKYHAEIDRFAEDTAAMARACMDCPYQQIQALVRSAMIIANEQGMCNGDSGVLVSAMLTEMAQEEIMSLLTIKAA